MSLSEQEKKILEFWEKENIFAQSLEQTKEGEKFVFYDGPITVNADPGIHHVLARIFKDIIPRFKTMQGYHVQRKNGWDTHGLPVELEVEKKLDFKTKKEIEDYGIKKFNKKCKENVKKYIPVFKKLTKRIGYWVDMEEGYTTFESDYIESLWWIMKQIWEKDLLYEDLKVVPYCSRCGTSLSSHEVAQGYKEITEPAVFIKFQITPNQSLRHGSRQEKFKIPDNTYLLAWTTTPWTLPGNVALAVDDKLEYVLISLKDKKENLILAKSRLEAIEDDYKIIKEFKGKKLKGTTYKPLYEIEAMKKDENYKNAYQVYDADFVEAEEGSGIVHTACMYGVEDFELGKKKDLPQVHTVTKEGAFKDELSKNTSGFLSRIEGKYVKEADPLIVEDLKKEGLLYKKEDYTHEYPFCWRCGTPLLYYAKTSWFIKMADLKEDLMKNNKMVNWTPSHLKKGRFGEWLEGVKDWAFSRDRFWGTPIPIWRCKDCGNEICIGSVEELKQVSSNFDAVYQDYQDGLPDLHRPEIDKIEIECEKCGKNMERIPYVADVWFDSGAMPFAQQHYPFENKEQIEKKKLFPADYISEAIDQTRGWFYTLLAVSTLLEKGAPYKNVLCLGLVFDENGDKMSKSKGNIVKPLEQIEKYGVDPIRWFFYVANSPDKAKKYDEEELENHLRRLFFTLGNSIRFLKMYAPGKTRFSLPKNPQNTLDQWLLSRLNKVTKQITKDLESFRITKAARRIEEFVDDLSNWYIRASRDRFQNPSDQKKLKEATSVLGHTLFTTLHLLAPFCPFYSEDKYRILREEYFQGEIEKSIHLRSWPKAEKQRIKTKLESAMEKARKITSLGLQERRDKNIKVRQPLAEIKVKGAKLSPALTELLKKELNVKSVTYQTGGELDLTLDTKITPALEQEGGARELIRTIQSLRKKRGLTPEDKIEIWVEQNDFSEAILKENREDIKAQTRSSKIKLVSSQKINQQNTKKVKATKEFRVCLLQ